MSKNILAGLLLAVAAVGCDALEANQATQAELESIKGIGPSLCVKILDARRNGAFKDWQDMIARVSGIGEHNAAKFSADGLTVNGVPFRGAAPAVAQ